MPLPLKLDCPVPPSERGYTEEYLLDALTMSPALISLSPSIRDWVVLPMLLLMVLTMFLRAGTGPLLRSSKQIPAADRKVREYLG